MNAPFGRLGGFLRDSRIAAGLSQTEVARALKFKQQFISNWERGIASPPLRTLKVIAHLYRVPLSVIQKHLLEDSIERVRSDLKEEFRKVNRR